jgi:2-phosphosulfolactate phosphatase
MSHDNFKITVVIDVFRAFTTACYVLERHPTSYFYSYSCKAVEKLTLQTVNPFLIGKPEKGSQLKYHIPNSPTYVAKKEIKNRDIIHRSESGARGILSSQKVDLILAAGFVNARATVDYIKTFKNSIVTILPMGHEATSPSLEDEICAQYLLALLNSKFFNTSKYVSELASGPGKYFFSDDQNQYPEEDFAMCLELNKFNFAIQAQLHSDYAVLRRCDIVHLSDTFETKSVLILSKNP